MKNPPRDSERPTDRIIDFDPKAAYHDAELRNKLRKDEERRVAEVYRLMQLVDSIED